MILPPCPLAPAGHPPTCTCTCLSSGRRLEDLGSPSEAGQRFLLTTVAPAGSGRQAELLAASSRCAMVLCTSRLISVSGWGSADLAGARPAALAIGCPSHHACDAHVQNRVLVSLCRARALKLQPACADVCQHHCCRRFDDQQTMYYVLEYTVRGPQLSRHNVSIYAARCCSPAEHHCGADATPCLSAV